MKQTSAKSNPTEYWIAILLFTWPLAGMFLDGWNHNHLTGASESFFNPYHLVMYSGFAACLLFLAFLSSRNHSRGYSWRNSLAPEYRPTLIGAVILTCGIFIDLVWHQLFGFEGGIDAVLSPAHAILALGASIAASFLLQTIWSKRATAKVPKFAVVLSFTYFYLVLAFMTQYIHPYFVAWAGSNSPMQDYSTAGALGAAGAIIYTGIFCMVLFSTLRYFKFPVGGLFLFFVLESIAMSSLSLNWLFIVQGVVAGLIIDLLYQQFYGRLENLFYLRLFGFLVPAVFFLCYLSLIVFTQGTNWTVHLLAGLVVTGGATGLLLTYVLATPHTKFTIVK